MHKVYLFEKTEKVPEALIASALLLLPEQRRKKAARYHQVIDRKNCVITYLMLKAALKKHFRITKFTLQYGEYGKPYLAEYPDIYFNISHCRFGCAAAVADRPIGVDIQDIRPFSREIALRVCCKEELEWLRISPDRNRDFIRMWAMKESCIKKAGIRIGSNLSEINTLAGGVAEITDRKESVLSVCI